MRDELLQELRDVGKDTPLSWLNRQEIAAMLRILHGAARRNARPDEGWPQLRAVR